MVLGNNARNEHIIADKRPMKIVNAIMIKVDLYHTPLFKDQKCGISAINTPSEATPNDKIIPDLVFADVIWASCLFRTSN
ncbi:hypothetical protein THOB06_540004 [Vibrio rotiferianus]|nr:hypothetical protein THOG10_540004 [Vibrio rotiferianus]CAH1592378.1 hypothetical protein THOB06_540004 [Vibrio rotiferianus]